MNLYYVLVCSDENKRWVESGGLGLIPGLTDSVFQFGKIDIKTWLKQP
jgi:hypothetical protein